MSKPLGPYSPFVRAGDFVIVSGQGGMRDGAIVEGGVAAQTTQTMANVAARLAEAGAELQRRRQDAVLPHRHGHVRRVQRRLRRGVRRPPPGPLDGRGVGAPRRDGRRGRGLGLQAGMTRERRQPTRCGWARHRRGVRRLPRHRVGRAGARRPAAVRVPAPRGRPGRAVVVDDPQQARGLRALLRRLRPGAGRRLRTTTTSSAASPIPGIVRNRAKVDAAVGNARAWLELDDPVAFLWAFVDGRPGAEPLDAARRGAGQRRRRRRR